jgi:hypothetical protein
VLPSLSTTIACPPAPTRWDEIHRTRGAPPAATAAIIARAGGASWMAVGDVYRAARHSAAADAATLRHAWTAYERACYADGTPPLPVTLRSITAMWFERVLGHGRKSSGLQSLTSRIFTRAGLLGREVAPEVQDAIWEELTRFRVDFPCQVSAAAPPLGRSDGRLDQAIAYVEQRAPNSLFFKEMLALLRTAGELYPRANGLLEGRLLLGHLLFQPPGPHARGGLVVRLILPKKNKHTVDLRRDSHPIPMGPTVTAVLSFLEALGLLSEGASREACVFPDIDPRTDAIRGPALTVTRSSYLLRRYVFVPAGLLGGHLLTLRSIRYGASTDAVMAGVPEPIRLATGGWGTQQGSKPYVDLSVATLLSPAGPAGPTPTPAAGAGNGGTDGSRELMPTLDTARDSTLQGTAPLPVSTAPAAWAEGGEQLWQRSSRTPQASHTQVPAAAGGAAYPQARGGWQQPGLATASPEGC